MTKAQIDRLGERLRTQGVSDGDLRLLDQYRRSFADAYAQVVKTVRQCLGQEPTGRPAKSTTSIVDKLRRESIRLSQVQDIAGCRLVVSDVLAQQKAIERLSQAFGKATVVDRREHPSHGYRAVHVIAFVEGQPVEIQVRTTLQHLWAEFSEKLSDVLDPGIKYGGGADKPRSALADTSRLISSEEALEVEIARREAEFGALRDKAAEARQQVRSTLTQLATASLTSSQFAARQQLEQSQTNLEALDQQITSEQEAVRLGKERLVALKEATALILREAITSLPERKGDA